MIDWLNIYYRAKPSHNYIYLCECIPCLYEIQGLVIRRQQLKLVVEIALVPFKKKAIEYDITPILELHL